MNKIELLIESLKSLIEVIQKVEEETHDQEIKFLLDSINAVKNMCFPKNED
jgi:hypothetical protein